MRSFQYYKATTVAQVLSLLTRHGQRAAILAGGSDILSMMKDRIEGPKFSSPQHLIDIKGIKALNFIKEQGSGLKIGATTTLNDISSSPIVSTRYPVLASAARQVAVPQIRNVGTLGGNLCQRPRCWYFRGRLFKDCLRKGGGDCYAQGGENQYHAIFGADVCAMVCPSDMASALTALNAKVEIATPKGKRLVPVEQFFMRPEKTVLKETTLGPSEMVLAVEIPGPEEGFRGTYIKLKERQAFDFATASVAVGLTLLQGGLVSNSRIILGGVASFPFRAVSAEAALKGKKVQEAIGAASRAAVEGARPLSNNGYKVKAARGLIEQALASLA